MAFHMNPQPLCQADVTQLETLQARRQGLSSSTVISEWIPQHLNKICPHGLLNSLGCYVSRLIQKYPHIEMSTFLPNTLCCVFLISNNSCSLIDTQH